MERWTIGIFLCLRILLASAILADTTKLSAIRALDIFEIISSLLALK